MDLGELIQRGDPDELLLEVDRRCATRDWDGLVTVRDRCDAAVELGRQLWSVARYAEYRLALEAPGSYAASVCRTGTGRFTLGPLTEVAASSHAWDDLADGLGEPWVAATVAQERVLRGEDLRGDARAHPEELDLPMVLAEWEPDYPLPTYRSHELLEGGPGPVSFGEAATTAEVRGSVARDLDRPELERALRDVVAVWADSSNGACEVRIVEGDASAAVVALGRDGVRMAAVPLEVAVARLVWTAASGGAYGRRRGMAAGRSTFWWLAHRLTDLPYPADPVELGAQLTGLRWFAFDGSAGDRGWSLRLAVEAPDAGWAAAIDAWDAHRPEDGRGQPSAGPAST